MQRNQEQQAAFQNALEENHAKLLRIIEESMINAVEHAYKEGNCKALLAWPRRLAEDGLISDEIFLQIAAAYPHDLGHMYEFRSHMPEITVAFLAEVRRALDYTRVPEPNARQMIEAVQATRKRELTHPEIYWMAQLLKVFESRRRLNRAVTQFATNPPTYGRPSITALDNELLMEEARKGYQALAENLNFMK